MDNRTLEGIPGGICKFPECGLTYYSREYCIGHYRQLMRGVTLKPLRRREPTLEARFWAKVDKSGDCWTWTGCAIAGGYGRISVGGTLQLAHRVSYAWANGPIPDGMIIDHTCHTPSCVRPSHLRSVTIKQNQEHRLGARRDSKTGYLGVKPHKDRFHAAVRHHGVDYYLGSYASVEEAHAAVTAKRIEMFTHNDHDRNPPPPPPQPPIGWRA